MAGRRILLDRGHDPPPARLEGEDERLGVTVALHGDGEVGVARQAGLGPRGDGEATDEREATVERLEIGDDAAEREFRPPSPPGSPPSSRRHSVSPAAGGGRVTRKAPGPWDWGAYDTVRLGVSMIRVLDPRLDPDQEPLGLAPPVASLTGATVGLLDNAKIGTARFFDHLEALLRERHGLRDVIRRRKPDSSRPAPAELLRELTAADALVSAVGD